ncbi:type II toxin-antitoxin system RelB/DinJ family antitoxin [bacterium]|nr:type II toxin-antitoxin system RelB/DinJ family antitoxin [bacterium]
MGQTNINIRIDEQLKKQFDALCNELGMSMTTAINIFAKAMVRHRGLPFEVSLGIPNEETIQAMEDVENKVGLYGPYFIR